MQTTEDKELVPQGVRRGPGRPKRPAEIETITVPPSLGQETPKRQPPPFDALLIGGHDRWVGYPGSVAVIKGQPVNRDNEPMLETQRIVVLLQGGFFYSEDGSPLADAEVPSEVRSWRGSHARRPGVTEAARVLQCPACNLRWPIKRLFEGHLVAHGFSPERVEETLRSLEQGETIKRLSVPWDEGDFAGPPMAVVEVPVTDEA